MSIKFSRSESGCDNLYVIIHLLWRAILSHNRADLKKKLILSPQKRKRIDGSGNTRGKISRYIAIINNLVCGQRWNHHALLYGLFPSRRSSTSVWLEYALRVTFNLATAINFVNVWWRYQQIRLVFGTDKIFAKQSDKSITNINQQVNHLPEFIRINQKRNKHFKWRLLYDKYTYYSLMSATISYDFM